MKKFKQLNWILIALIVFQFTSCSNEPLVGEFPLPDDTSVAEAGQLKAQIDGVEFLSTVAGATLTTDNFLTILGTDDVTGETIALFAEEAGAVGVYNLTEGIGLENKAQYYALIDTTNPYVSSGAFGGSGQLTVTELNTTDLTISGSFSFVGKRTQLDANGDPVLDGDGLPIIQTVNITPGVFNMLPYVIDDTTGGGGGGGGDPLDEFYALIDGVEFFDTSISTTLTTIGGIEMVNIVAQTSTSSLIRIDIPLFQGLGTYPMVALSDGTKIIGLYNSNTGGENLTSSPGTITVTEFDTEAGVIIATFEFVGSDPLGQDPTIVAVTDGSFTVHFEGIPGSGPSPFIADVDGVVYEPETIDIVFGVFSGTEIVSISANTSDNKNMTLSFPKNIEVGTYDMSIIRVDGSEKIGSYNPDTTAGTVFVSNPGVLVISSYDLITGEIVGTFSFVGKDPTLVDPTQYEIMNGSFNLTLL